MAQAVSIGDVEALVARWGMWARRHTERLGLPSSSSICRMIEQSMVFDRKRKKHNPEKQLTAWGRQTRVVTALKIGYVEPDIMAVDRIVSRLPNRYKKAIYRRYMYLQPDRIAAKQLRIERETYTGMVEAAVEYIAEKLELSEAIGV